MTRSLSSRGEDLTASSTTNVATTAAAAPAAPPQQRRPRASWGKGLIIQPVKTEEPAVKPVEESSAPAAVTIPIKEETSATNATGAMDATSSTASTLLEPRSRDERDQKKPPPPAISSPRVVKEEKKEKQVPYSPLLATAVTTLSRASSAIEEEEKEREVSESLQVMVKEEEEGEEGVAVAQREEGSVSSERKGKRSRSEKEEEDHDHDNASEAMVMMEVIADKEEEGVATNSPAEEAERGGEPQRKKRGRPFSSSKNPKTAEEDQQSISPRPAVKEESSAMAMIPSSPNNQPPLSDPSATTTSTSANAGAGRGAGPGRGERRASQGSTSRIGAFQGSFREQ